MKEEFQNYIDYHKNKGGTGKLFKFELVEYKPGFLKLKGFFNSETLNPVGTVQGGQINSMLDDVTSLLLIYESVPANLIPLPTWGGLGTHFSQESGG